MQMKFQKYLLVLALLFLATLNSCSSSEWDNADQDELIDRCKAEGGSKSYCKCYLKNAMEKFPNADDMDEIQFETAVELSLNCE